MDDKQLEVVQTVEAMFRVAPGARYLNEFVAFIKNTGSSVKELAKIFTQSDIFKQSLYSDTLSNSVFAHQFVENTVGTLVNKEDKAWAAAAIEKMLDAGESRGEIIHGRPQHWHPLIPIIRIGVLQPNNLITKSK